MISVVLATYNEEANIEKCLNSVADFADEIVVVDGTSVDKTREIAKKFGARVIKTTNKANFHINKQMAMDEAKGSLVLQLDADELVDKDLKEFVIKTHKSLEKDGSDAKVGQPVAWWIKRKNYFMGKFLTKGGQYPDPVIRLYINGFAKLPQEDVHEQMSVEGEVGWAEGHLIHYSNPRLEDYFRKFNTYTSFKAKQLLESGLTLSLKNSLNYLIFKPVVTFLSLFVRHKGFVDGIPGFVFALMSGLHHSVAWLKFWELHEKS